MLHLYFSIIALCAVAAQAASQVNLAPSSSPPSSCVSDPTLTSCCSSENTTGTVCVDSILYEYTCGRYASQYKSFKDMNGTQCMQECNRDSHCRTVSWNTGGQKCYLNSNSDKTWPEPTFILLQKKRQGDCSGSDDRKDCKEQIEALKQCTTDNSTCTDNLSKCSSVQSECDLKLNQCESERTGDINKCEEEKKTCEKDKQGCEDAKNACENDKTRRGRGIADPDSAANQEIMKRVNSLQLKDSCEFAEGTTFTTKDVRGTWNEWEILCDYYCNPDSVDATLGQYLQTDKVMDHILQQQDRPDYYGFSWLTNGFALPLFRKNADAWPKCSSTGRPGSDGTRYHMVRRTKAFY